MFFRLILLVQRLRQKRRGTLMALFGLVVFAISVTAGLFYWFEGRHRDPVLDFGDAMWFAVVSITTIGYGDIYPNTAIVRWSVVVFTMLLGLTSFSLFVGVLVDTVSTAMSQGRRGMLALNLSGHLLIVHLPAERRLRQILAEVQADDRARTRRAVLVAENLSERPEACDDLLFVRGSPLTQDTWRRAAADRAAMAIVLATDYADPHSDAVVASTVVMLKQAAPGLHVVAELLDADKRGLLEAARADGIVPALEIAGTMLVQESQDPGVAGWLEEIATNRTRTQIYTQELRSAAPSLLYRTLAQRSISLGASLVGIRRKGRSHAQFLELRSEPGDALIYIAEGRLTDAQWEQLARATT